MDHNISQDYNLYLEEDHSTWSILFGRHQKLFEREISHEYISGFHKMKLNPFKIVDLEDVSRMLETETGWKLIPVAGLIPTRDFFYMLINKKYPVTISIRKEHEIDFSEQPDIFHDICGHVPLLANERFVKFLTAYSILALKYLNNDRAINLLGRLYWFTFEMGVINENGKQRAYGGAIITSRGELANLKNKDIPKYSFDLDLIFSTDFSPYKLQKQYFVVDSFDELFDTLAQVETKLIEHLSLPEVDFTIRNFSLNKNIGSGFNDVIGFLNDVQFRFPKAISFVAGQPDETFFGIEDCLSKFNTYVDFILQATPKKTRTEVINNIGQYNQTKGIINDVLARYLKMDENIDMTPDKILVTVGAQEAFAIILSTLCNRDTDVVLVENPSYIGVSSFARAFDYAIVGVDMDENGIDLRKLQTKVIEQNRLGKKVKLVYVIPDYQNPSGTCMPIVNRLLLLELAQKYNFLIIEDSVYNSFTYSQRRNPTLKSLDKYNRVIYVSSFSKSLFPGLRIGLIGADQKIENDNGEPIPLVDEMVKIKAQLTNNTSTISQAILAGVLIHNNFSLQDWSKSKFESYKIKCAKMLDCLNKYLRNNSDGWADQIFWNEPTGGFFIKMTVPFDVDSNSVYKSASEFNVIFCPMRNFYINGGGKRELRLTFSNLSLDEIEIGVKRLACYLESEVMKGAIVLTES